MLSERASSLASLELYLRWLLAADFYGTVWVDRVGGKSYHERCPVTIYVTR